ncbi:MAG: malate dehydrogenase [Salinivirgaceae bacterium]|jgi:malate dehydrogenase (oxaloacetate-decarboxylating)(NADP+)|nr:malate dehydrogenase [Salinivirgaceae bacterium]
MDTLLNKKALLYHTNKRPGKIEVKPMKDCNSSHDLSLAYTPGVAEPCLKIKENPNDVYKYTIKGNLVAVITNGTAVLGLGNLGALASKPVMEGKVMLLKKYADINGFDIELNTSDVDVFVRTVITMSPTFGAINLVDIKAPECFEIEKRLVDALDIPVMHDNQHGTAIVSAASLINACEIAGKNLQDIKIVVSGSGAAAMACSEMYLSLGVKKENLIMLDSKGVISTYRIDLDKYKQVFAINTHLQTLKEAIVGADAYIGLSKTHIITPKMIQSMAESPIIFALANPNPEILYKDALKAKHGIIYASGCSGIPNQINNVLGFPYIFRAALDVRATKINIEMKKAAVYALASVAKVPYLNIDSNESLSFGRDYFIPHHSNFRLLRTIVPAVIEAAIKSGVANRDIPDIISYIKELDKRIIK